MTLANPQAFSQMSGRFPHRGVLRVSVRGIVVALFLSLFPPVPADAQQKAQSPAFLTIKTPIADAGEFLMRTFVPGDPEALSARGYRFVAIRGVIDWKEQQRRLSAEPMIYDFEIQRQQARTRENPWSGAWTTLDIDNAIGVLQQSFDLEQGPVPESLLNPVITMPLPRRVLGIWGQFATHPDLKDHLNPPQPTGNSQKPSAPQVKLFRYFDFDVTPGAVYRYRVRIEYQNPFFGKPPGKLAEGRTRTSGWSEPTPAVQVLPAAQFYLTGVEYDQVAERDLAVLDVFKWNAPTGTFVNDVQRFGVGDEIGGLIETKVVNPLQQTYVAQKINFSTGDVLIDLRDRDALPVNGTLPDLETVPASVSYDEILLMNSQGNLRTCDRVSREDEHSQARRYQQFQNEIGIEFERAAGRR